MKYTMLVIMTFLLTAFADKASTKQDSAEYTPAGKTIEIYNTASGTDMRLTRSDVITFGKAARLSESEVAVFVNPAKQFQTLLGIGGALTDASAEVFAALTPEKQKELLRAYYSPENGIGYTLARTTIHSCDFSSGSYTYVANGDSALETFSIEHDRQYRIPLIKRAIRAAGGNLVLYASPWSPPAFMKTNNDMLHGGKLLPAYYPSWANYYVKFIRAYEQEGIPVWGITIQNEPMAKQIWESCLYTAEEERDFLKNYLGPTLWRAGLADKKIIVWDHNRDFITHRANTIFGDPGAARYAWGIGFHWYEPWAGGKQMFSNLTRVREAFPEKHLIFTEGTTASFREEGYQTWEYGEKYGRSMINDFNRGTVGWTDWNILLDQRGGPNHVGNFCMAPVHADLETGELIYTPSYYYIGHFSKFIRPGAKRVSTAPSRSHLLATSFMNEDGTIVTVVMNQSDQEIQYRLVIGGNQSVLTILPHAIQTLIY